MADTVSISDYLWLALAAHDMLHGRLSDSEWSGDGMSYLAGSMFQELAHFKMSDGGMPYFA